MVFHENNEPTTAGSSKPRTRQSNQQNDMATQVSRKLKVSSAMRRLKAKEKIPSDIQALPDQRFESDIRLKDVYRPKSAGTVLQYADVPIQIKAHPLGRPTRATVLRNLRRSQSASSACSDFSWIQDNRRLCNIRDYYRLFKHEKSYKGEDSSEGESVHAYLTGARFNSAHWLDSSTLKTRGLYISKGNLKNVFLVGKSPVVRSVVKNEADGSTEEGIKNTKGLLEVRGKGLMKDVSVNTEHHYLSIVNWHGAEWQRNLPGLYQPVKEKYNPNSSAIIRAKRVKSEYRNPVQMATLKARRNKIAC